MLVRRAEAIERAQQKVQEAIEILEIACEGDSNAKAYMIDQLKVLCTDDSGFLTMSLNLSQLMERYINEPEECHEEDPCVEIEDSLMED